MRPNRPQTFQNWPDPDIGRGYSKTDANIEMPFYSDAVDRSISIKSDRDTLHGWPTDHGRGRGHRQSVRTEIADGWPWKGWSAPQSAVDFTMISYFSLS